MSYAFETPKDKNLNLADPSNTFQGNGLLTSRPSATLVQPLTVQPGNRYSISYLPGLSEKPIVTNLTLDEAKSKIVLLSCEVERLSRSNYDLVKECEFLRLDTDRPSKEKQLTNKIAIVLAENEKLNGIIDDIYKAYLGIYQPTSDDLSNYKGRIAEIMTNITKLQQGGATSEPTKVEALEQRIALLLEENEKLNQALMSEADNKNGGPGSNARNDGDKRYVELLLEENSKLNDTLNTKVLENEGLKREVDSLKQKLMVNQTTYQYQTTSFQKDIEALKGEKESLNNQIKAQQEENISLGVTIEQLKVQIKEIKLKPVRTDILSAELLETVSALSAGLPSLDSVETKFNDFKAFIDSLVEQRLQEIEVLRTKAQDLDNGRVDVADVRGRLTQANLDAEKLKENKAELEKRYLEEVDADNAERNALNKDLQDRTVRLDRLEREAASLRETVPTDDLLTQVKLVQDENEKLKNSINDVLSRAAEPGSAEEFQSLKLQSVSLAANVEKVSQELTYYRQRYEKIRSSPPDIVVELLKEAEIEAQRKAQEEAERQAKEEADRIAKEEADRLAAQEAAKKAAEEEKARKAQELPTVHVEGPADEEDLKQSNVIESVTRQDAAEEKPIKKVTSAKKEATGTKKEVPATPRKEDAEFAQAEKDAKATDAKDAKKTTKKTTKKPDNLEVDPNAAQASSRRSSIQGENLPTESDAPAKKTTTTKKTTKAGEEAPKTPSKEAPKLGDELKKSDVKKTPTAKDAAGKLLPEEKKEEKKVAEKKTTATKDVKAESKTALKDDKSETKSVAKSEAKTETKAEAKPAADKKAATGTGTKTTKK